jgi:hypothetical protein
MATDAAAAAKGVAESKGYPAMKSEFTKHAEYLNALVRRPLPLLDHLVLAVMPSLHKLFLPRNALREPR